MALHAQARQLARSGGIELGVLAAQCLDRRIPDKQTLIDEIAAWEHDRNVHHTKSDWPDLVTKMARDLARPCTRDAMFTVWPK